MPNDKPLNSIPSSSQLSLCDNYWETADPNPDIHALFLQFNERFFWGKLAGIEVRWSSKMTLCAGLCSYERRGGMCSVRLSTPLLKLRPRSDLVNTLLHEMIHAYLFVTHNNKDRDSHGPEFHKHMHRINKEALTRITVYHTFHDEVRLYKQHWWKCNGPCKSRHPFYGLVKRAMNRKPGPNDFWWQDHQRSCGGTFIKIKEPEGYQNKNKKPNQDEVQKPAKSADSIVPFSGKGKSMIKSQPISSYFNPSTASTSQQVEDSPRKAVPNSQNSSSLVNQARIDYFIKKGIISNQTSNCDRKRPESPTSSQPRHSKLPKISSDASVGTTNNILNQTSNCDSKRPECPTSSQPRHSKLPKMSSDASVRTTNNIPVMDLTESKVNCPVCSHPVDQSKINVHLDECLSAGIINEERQIFLE